MTTGRMRPFLVVTLGLAVSIGAALSAWAQREGGSSDTAAEESSTGTKTGSQIYVPALNSNRLINLGEVNRFLLLYGMGVTQGYDDRVGDTVRQARADLSIWSPYVGLAAQTSKTRYVFQYAPFVTHYTSQNLPTQAFHRTSFFSLGQLAPRWEWNFSASGSYGDESLRLLAPLAFNANGDIPMADPSSVTFELGSSRVFRSETAIGLGWRRNERDRVEFTLGHSYYTFFGTNEPNNVVGALVNYSHAVSERTSVRAYGNMHNRFGQFFCRSVGGGVGVVTELSRRTTLELSGGPQINSPRCGKQQAYNFHAALVWRVNPTTRTYVAVNREFSTAYRARSRWEDNAVVGLARRITSMTEAGFDGGFGRGEPVDRSSALRGFFLSSYFRWSLSRTVNTIATYRRFYRTVGNENLNRNIVMFSLEWSPAPVGLF